MVAGVPHSLAVGQGISCHAWNSDKSMIAVCPNSPTVLIYKTGDLSDPKAKWELAHELSEHDQVVTGIAWAPKSNLIVTASQDRNAYVWKEENGVWKPTLVILRISRGATCVKWSADEKKFAVGSGQKCVPVCYYDPGDDWWVSKMIKKHKSTVLDVDWHPTLPILATGSSDFKCRIFAAYLKNVDDKELSKVNPWEEGGKLGFGDVLQEFSCGGWVHSVQWSPSGNHLIFAGHDSTMSFVTIKGKDSAAQTVKLSTLPFRRVQFLNDSVVVGVGHEFNPHVFQESGGQWELKGKLDKKTEKKAAAQSTTKAAFSMFQNQDKRATSGAASSNELTTKHQNSVSALVPLTELGQEVTRFTTSGLDGLVVFWDLGSVSAALNDLD